MVSSGGRVAEAVRRTAPVLLGVSSTTPTRPRRPDERFPVLSSTRSSTQRARCRCRSPPALRLRSAGEHAGERVNLVVAARAPRREAPGRRAPPSSIVRTFRPLAGSGRRRSGERVVGRRRRRAGCYNAARPPPPGRNACPPTARRGLHRRQARRPPRRVVGCMVSCGAARRSCCKPQRCALESCRAAPSG
jgi:hypothetical protein